jgi:hypothetical protein
MARCTGAFLAAAQALALAALLAACGGKTKETVASPAADGEGGDPNAVVITLDDEESMLDVDELKAATEPCGDLLSLEPQAMMGKLKDPQIRCLDESLRTAQKQTVKDKISRVLMADAYAKGDLHRWDAVAKRHLETIDRSDPDLCYKYALHLLNNSPADHMDEAMRWADVSLENRSVWSGDVFVQRVYSLYKLKAMAAQKKWNWLEEEYVRAPSETLSADKEEARNLTKTNSREWLEYARNAGKDTTLATQMCMSAAGTEAFCAPQ